MVKIGKSDMQKRIFRALAVLGLLLIMSVCEYLRMRRDALQVSGEAVTGDIGENSSDIGTPAKESGVLNAGDMDLISAWAGREQGNDANRDRDTMWIGPVKLPGKPKSKLSLLQESLPVMGACYSADTPHLVAIDPGHLGYTADKYFNSGAMSVYGTPEYEWTMQIGLLLSEELTARGYDVYLMRTTNNQKEYPYNNGQRAQAANDMNCDILVSIHWDSNENEETVGYHTIYKGSKYSQAYRLAKAVSDAYGAALDGQIKKYVNPMSRKDLWELSAARMPAIILECGFSSNRDEAGWLENEENYGIIVQGIADGIDNYFAGERARNK